jgi:hypothetical protein
MKKTFTLNIAEPCNEDFTKMIKNQIGSHCDLCNKTVLDFTRKTTREVATIISKQKDKTSIRAEVSPMQLHHDYSYNTSANYINLKHAMLFGATVLTTIASYSQEKPSVQIIENNPNIEVYSGIAGKIAVSSKRELIKVMISEILKDAKTKKAIIKKEHPNLKLFYSGKLEPITINPRTRKFNLEIELFSDEKSILMYVDYNTVYQDLQFTIDKEEIKSGKVTKTIFVDTSKKFEESILGGLGINYKEEILLNAIIT